MTENESACPLAVVTGASSGIGYHLAAEFARNGFDVLAIAEDDALAAAAEDLRAHGTRVEDVRADLTTAEGVERVAQRVRAGSRPVAALALNAGVGEGGAFIDQDPADQLEIVDLNVRSTVQLARLLLPDMARRGEGRVLFTSSIAATMPGTYQAVYNASKSFVQSLAAALREELRETGVTVTSLMPGPTETAFFARADMEQTPVGRADKDDPADVARDAFEALMAGREKVAAGSLVNTLQTVAGRFVPDALKAKVHGVMAKPASSG